MNKIIYIPAPFKATFSATPVKVSTGETKKGWFREKPVYTTEHHLNQTGWSDCEVDGEKFSSDISIAVEELNSNGFEVVAVTPITSGAYNFRNIESERSMIENREIINGGGYGYGYSYTEGVMITARKKTTTNN